MPSVCRRIAAVLVVACLGVALPASLALAQDAGDQQYQDPFGGSTTTSKPKSKPKSQTNTTTTDQNLAPLSPSPQTSGQGTSGTSGSSSKTTTTPAAASRQAGLPNTGVDARLLLAAGGLLLLTGLGLRLRTTPERF